MTFKGDMHMRNPIGDSDKYMSDSYRRNNNPATAKKRDMAPGVKTDMEPTRNCNTCGFSKPMINKIPGVRIPGGFGKCTRKAGPCDVETPALGIGGVRSDYKYNESVWVKKKGGM